MACCSGAANPPQTTSPSTSNVANQALGRVSNYSTIVSVSGSQFGDYVAATPAVTPTAFITITDSAGNVAPESPALTIEVDATNPPALGTPDLITEFDTGESNSDNLTNLGAVNIGQTDTIPGFKWVLFSATDNGDGIYNEVDDVPVIPLDSNLFGGGA